MPSYLDIVMKKLLIFYISIVANFFVSCKEKSKPQTEPEINSVAVSDTSSLPINPVTVNDRLLSFKIDLVTTIGDMSNRDKKRYDEIFSKELSLSTDTVRYLNGKIYISCIKPAVGCADYKGDIMFRNDTLILLINNTSDKACSEMETWRTVYEVENSSNKKYVIEKR